MFTAMGTEPRLRIMQLLLSAHPDGLVVGEIQSELGIPNSTLSHHLEKLKNEDLVKVRRESTFLWYTANTEALQELLGFLYAECCTRNKAVKPRGRSSPLLQVDATPFQGNRTMEIKEIVKEKYGQAALRVTTGGSSCCGASASARRLLRRSDHVQSVRRRPDRANPRRGRARFARLRQSDGAGQAQCR